MEKSLFSDDRNSDVPEMLPAIFFSVRKSWPKLLNERKTSLISRLLKELLIFNWYSVKWRSNKAILLLMDPFIVSIYNGSMVKPG